MEKIAEQVKMAEVNGFTGALIDAGFLKVASEEEAAVIAEIIAENLPEDYTMEDAMAIAAEIIEALEGEEVAEPEGEGGDMVVEASDKEDAKVDERAVMAAYGELAMAKEAGEISEAEFEKEATNALELLGRGLTGTIPLTTDVSRRLAMSKMKQLFTGQGARNAYADFKHSGKQLSPLKEQVAKSNAARVKALGAGAKKKTVGNLAGGKELLDRRSAALREMLREGGKTGLAVGGVAGGAGLGAKSLYDKYSD